MAANFHFDSPSFKLVTRGLIALHQLIKEGEADSPEAEAVRDTLDGPLRGLNPAERERARWLSEDLYSVSEPPAGTSQKEMNAQAQQQLSEVFEARQSREWDRSLALLRRWRDYISPSVLSYLRGSIWLAAGDPDVAAVFYAHASEIDPTNASYRAVYLRALVQSDPATARKLARDILAHAENHSPEVITQAANIRFNETKTSPESAQLYQDLIEILERTLARINEEGGAASDESRYIMTVGLLGFCNEVLGNAGAAADFYTRGLEVGPDEGSLLLARGVLLYGSSPRAVIDLERAVQLGSPVVWPYLFLAHHFLITNRFDPCRAMCETGLKMQGSDTAKSHLQEWRAIAQAELGFPRESVRAAFEAAIRLDPSNEQAKRNYKLFEASLRVPHVSRRLTWEQKSEAAVRQFGLAERRYSLAA